jgi:hypothetical protein
VRRRPLLHERLGYAPEVIENQLGHSVLDRLGKAYNRTKFIKTIKIIQNYADYLEKRKLKVN